MNPKFFNCVVIEKVFGCGIILQINQLILLLIRYAVNRTSEWISYEIQLLALSFDAILVIRYLSFPQLIRKACIQFILRTT